MYEEFSEKLRDVLAGGQILVDEPMSRHTSFRVGGPADLLLFPSSRDELRSILSLSRRYDVPVTIVGNGSNTLVRDQGIRGAVIAFGAPFSFIVREGGEGLRAGAGAMLGAVSRFAAERSLSGLEFAVGIPGSLGGAVCMNAGAYGGEMKDVVRSVRAMDRLGNERTVTTGGMELGYRTSVFQKNGEIVFEIELALSKGDPSEIAEKMAGFTRRRVEKQPLDRPSAGSTFKRPSGHFAGTLIEEAGLKGFSVGGAMVSEKHAGFVVNAGGATAADIIALIDAVKERVYARSGVELVPEVRILGE